MPLTVASIDKNTGVLTYAVAALIAPVILRCSTREDALKSGKSLKQKDLVHLLERNGVPLGEQREMEFTIGTAQLEAGDILLFYTDGAIDVANPEGNAIGQGNFLRAFLKAALCESEPDQILSRLLNTLTEYRAGTPLIDDTTIVVCKYQG